MSSESTPQLDIFGDVEDGPFGDSLQVKAVKELVAEIQDSGTMTIAKRVLCANALKYAELAGDSKSAIAAVGATEKLTEIVERLTADQTQKLSDLPPEIVQLLAAFEVKSKIV